MKPIILVKHSLPEVVPGLPAREWKLSETGQVRTKELAHKLIGMRPEIIVSSVEPKAVETAHILAGHFGLESQAFDGLHEHGRSQSPYYAKDEFQRLMREFFATPDILVFGDETARQALARFRTALETVMTTFQDKTIMVVSHGTVISLYVAWLTGCDGYQLWEELGLPSFVVLDLQARQLLETVNLP